MAEAADLRAEVQALGEEIRELKASLKESGHSSSAINSDASLQALVAKLRDLKAQLPSGDSLSDEAFFQKHRQEQQARERQRQGRMEEERSQLKAKEKMLAMPLVQRKIFHALCFTGSGDSFHYEPPPRLNAEQTGFGSTEKPYPAVYVTEKWDGTTMQATSKAVYRRQEITGKARPKDPANRYELKLVAWRDMGAKGSAWHGFDFIEADKRVAEALSPYLARIEALEEGLCVYFECLHTNINTTYKHIKDFADIRVFDFSREGGSFVPFDESIALAKQYELPLVGWRYCQRLDPEVLWKELAAAKQQTYLSVQAPLEGFVLREAGGARIAKARVEHLKATPAERPETPGSLPGKPVVRAASAGGEKQLIAAEPGILTLGHLQAIGLHPGGGQPYLSLVRRT